MLSRALRQSSFHFGANVAQVASCRGIRRMRPTIGTTSDERELRLLRKLEGMLAEAKLKQKEDEQEARELLESASNPENPEVSQKHLVWFWNKAISENDREKLAIHGINSADDLQAAYLEADVAMSIPPFPQPDQLEARLQVAYGLCKRIPDLIMQAQTQSNAERFKSFKSLFGDFKF
ncbi:hypothetical protein D9758_001283 [Tetrapyrgos nigripes]|uniref:Uncharacterized protein n=1 Tax=Tetrapyrgos nigripes TaxID=182062 RepID=A0A8H5GS14_9AGAR|nr:hypothetical protein D9758_001283 [Tetrapyrgos nigripes]